VTRPLVSAIMPVFNAEDFVGAALESLLAQDYDPFEIVACDDGSTDRSSEILTAYPTVSRIRQANGGPSAARNAAVAASRGELIAFFDADDLWPSNRLTLQARHLVEHPEAGCVLGRQEWINPPPWLRRDAIYGDLDGIPLCSAMLRRSAFDAVGGFDTMFTHGEDRDLMFRLREGGIRIEVLSEIVLFRRFHGKNLTAAPPSTSPMLRSLKLRIDRERARERSDL
jgi:glycosyltransferase involved in cell wall biosynthesis